MISETVVAVEPSVRSRPSMSALPAEWPADGLEFLGKCPVCGSTKRDLLFKGLRDRIFFCAPSSWDMQSCRGCGSAYLDPRPTVATIGLAYHDYYTHEQQARLPADQLTGVRLRQRLFANGYKNWKFGTDLQPSSKLGVLVAFLLPPHRATLDRQYRHLPRDRTGRVLDVGFGDAGFLEAARDMGWDAVGTDFDPKVVESARARGLDARLGTVDGLDGPFDVITMSHVIEHLHDPRRVLRSCHALLAPGGTLWIETPNVEAIGLRRFGRFWRGLEPPRHLVLFSRASLLRILREEGFANVRDLAQPSPITGMYVMSASIREGRDPSEPATVSLLSKLEMMLIRVIEWLFTSRREFLAVTARKEP
jgi:SAM-dependent methyltransferase